MFLTALKNAGQGSGIFDAILVGFARSIRDFRLQRLAFIGGKTAVFSRRGQVVGWC